MAKKSNPKPPKDEKPPVNEKLRDMDIRVNEFGQIIRDYDIDDLNKFLNEHVKDKKFEKP